MFPHIVAHLGKHGARPLQRRILGFVPVAYRRIAREALHECPSPPREWSMRATLRRLAADDALACIRHHEEHNKWDISFGLTEDAAAGNASVTTVRHVESRDYSLTHRDLERILVVHDRRDVFLSYRAQRRWNMEELLVYACAFDRPWVAEWMSATKKRSKQLHHLFWDAFESTDLSESVFPHAVVRCVVRNGVLLTEDTHLDSLIEALSTCVEHEAVTTTMLCALLKAALKFCYETPRLNPFFCDEAAGSARGRRLLEILTRWRCRCAHPERHAQ